MININKEFFEQGIPESKLFTDKDSNRLEISKTETAIEGFKRQITEIELKLREIELEHQDKEYSPETFNIVKQFTSIKRKVELNLLNAENRLKELKKATE